MKSTVYYLIILSSILLSSCKNDKPSSIIDDSELKNISELSYLEIYHALFSNNNGGFDAHGDLYGQDAVSNLSFSEDAGSCGNTLYLSNNFANDSITLALKATFNFPGNPTIEMIRAYTIAPNEKISVGNTNLCYDDKEYAIKREIISAGFSNN